MDNPIEFSVGQPVGYGFSVSDSVGVTVGAVRYDQAQSLTDAQKAQARSNIGAYAKPADGIPKTDLSAAVLDDLVKYDNDEFASPLPLNADQLNGHPDTYFAKQEDMSAAETDIARKYEKPSSGIPKTDLARDVQTSLDLADSALQEHQSLAAYRTAAAQDAIDAQKYSARNPPPYPVTSVNGQTGGVVLNYITYDEEEE